MRTFFNASLALFSVLAVTLIVTIIARNDRGTLEMIAATAGPRKVAPSPVNPTINPAPNPPVAQESKSQNPAEENPDLVRWARNDFEWAAVERIDKQLIADPSWHGKSIRDRIPELVRRTKIELGESARPSQGFGAEGAEKRPSHSAKTTLSPAGWDKAYADWFKKNKTGKGCDVSGYAETIPSAYCINYRLRARSEFGVLLEEGKLDVSKYQ